MRKGYTKLTKADFDQHPIWELQGSLTTAEPYAGKVPFQADRARAFFVRTNFTLADKTRLPGWTMVCVPPYDVHGLNPTILTDAGPVDLTKLARQPAQKDVAKALRLLSRTLDQIFPLQFETDVPVPSGPAKGEMKGFLHRFSYEDDKGWQQHFEIEYQSASEVDAAIAEFNRKEAARKAALEPSKEEKALLKAALAGDVKKIKSLLAKGVNVNCAGVFEREGYTRKKVTPLMLAAAAGHVPALHALVEAGADVHLADDSNEPRRSNNTALGYACRAGHTELAGLLLKAGANPNHRLSFGHTIFDEACYEGKAVLLKTLLASGADPNASCGKGDYFALTRAISGDRLSIVKLLLDHQADIEGADDDGWTSLIEAAKLLRQEIAEHLLERGADVKAAAGGGTTALHAAVTAGAFQNPTYDKGAKKRFGAAMQIVKALIEHGADVNATTRNGDTPLSLSKEARFPELTAYLLSAGAK